MFKTNILWSIIESWRADIVHNGKNSIVQIFVYEVLRNISHYDYAMYSSLSCKQIKNKMFLIKVNERIH